MGYDNTVNIGNYYLQHLMYEQLKYWLIWEQTEIMLN